MDKLHQIVSTYKPQDTTYHHSGLTKKPTNCNLCKLSPSTVGFCADWQGTKAKLALMFPSALSDDVVNGTPDKWSFINKYVHPIGLSKHDLFITHTIRCSLKTTKGQPNYPTGSVRKNAENSCRFYDNQHGESGKLESPGIEQFQPNRFLITFDPADIRRVPAYHRQLQKDMEKAKKFIKEGYRVCMLLGNEPCALIAPFTIGTGGCKSWRGTFWDIERWSFTAGVIYEEKPAFKEAKIKLYEN